VCYTDYDDLKQPFNSTVTVKIGEYRTADKTLACLLFEFSVNTTGDDCEQEVWPPGSADTVCPRPCCNE